MQLKVNILVKLAYSTKKPDKWKKHSVSIFVLTTVFEKMCPHLIWDVLSYLSRKKGISETFLSLGLFISRPRPTASASKMRPRLQKTFPRFPFFNLGNFGQISNQTWTNLSSDVVSTIIETKYYIYQDNIQNFGNPQRALVYKLVDISFHTL